jgi:hypothetical protein
LDSVIEKGNIKFNYLDDNDIYVIDFAGITTLKVGLSNIDLIENKLRELSAGKVCLKIILDLTNTIWENKETHHKLSKIARQVFNPKNFDYFIYMAIINNNIEGATFENEYWFLNKEEAIKWLIKKK